MNKKKVFIAILIIGLAIVGFYLYIDLTSSHDISYSSVSEYIDDNGKEYFVDMYNPESYFSSQEKKKISDINHYTIYHELDPQDYYSIPFQLENQLDLTMTVNRNDDNDYDVYTYQMEKESYANLYIKSDDTSMTIVSKKGNMTITFLYEFQHKTQNDLDKIKETTKNMLKDIYELNTL